MPAGLCSDSPQPLLLVMAAVLSPVDDPLPSPVQALLGAGGPFRKCSLMGGSEVTGEIIGTLDSLCFFSLCILYTR